MRSAASSTGGVARQSLARKHTCGDRQPGNLRAALEYGLLGSLDDCDCTRPCGPPAGVSPRRRAALVDAEQRYAGQLSTGGLDPAMAERVVMRQDRRVGDHAERIGGPPVEPVRPAGPDP